jgi:hypothetical protein
MKKKYKRVWPTNQDLLVWHLFQRLDETPHVESPDQITKWIDEVSRKTIVAIHDELYAGYEEFRKKFLPSEEN